MTDEDRISLVRAGLNAAADLCAYWAEKYAASSDTATTAKKKIEARDFESMGMACRFREIDIRSICASEIVKEMSDRGNCHDCIEQIEAQAAEIEKLREAVKMCLDELYAPDPNCSCHIRPPCNDCVDYSSIREVQDIARAALGETK